MGRCLLLLALLLPGSALAGGQDLPQPFGEWHGEFFGKKQGGIFVKMQLKGFKGASAGSSANVQVIVWNILAKKKFVLSHEPGDDAGVPRDLVAAPSGKYDIQQVVMVDGAGTKRIWKGGDAKKSFVVKRQCLSNLGSWTLSPQGKSGLAVSFDMAANSYKENGEQKDSSVAAVLNGFTGLIQEKVGGKKVLDGAANDYGNEHQLRATISFTRQIAMFYKLDLMKHNDHAKAVANVLSVYDPNIRKCYTDRLEVNDTLKGDVAFTFLLSKQTGTMAKLKRTGGTLADPKLAECMYFELSQIQFPVPENMIGELTYTFDVQ